MQGGPVRGGHLSALPRAGGLTRASLRPIAGPFGRLSVCDDEQLRYAPPPLLPARVLYEGKRAEKARTSTELHEDGFHGYARLSRLRHGRGADRVCPLCGRRATARAPG